MSKNGSKDTETDPNKVDFELLSRRSSISSSSNTSSVSSEPDTNVWPLHLTPKFICHYITGECIGSGSYAEVRECVDMLTLERLAIKIINKDYLRRQAPRALANQLQEIRLLRSLHHPNIISMRECLFSGSYIYIALEYCCYNLSDLLAEQAQSKLEPEFCRDFFHQLCSGLSYLHSMGVIHRDIKPQNLLINQVGLLKIIDFGVAQLLSIWQRDAKCSNYEGSPLFQAPEVIAGFKHYDGYKVDVWSSGVTLFLMLYGQYPFIDDTLLGLYDKILAEPYSIPSGPPTQLILIDLFACLLDKDHSRRMSVDQLLSHPWLSLSHAAGSNDDDDEDLEFLDFALETNQSLAERGGKRSTRDMYKSMSVLPYLYRHHFPRLSVQKSTSSPSPGQDSTEGTSSPNEDVNKKPDDKTEEEIEWGTREQYDLMKMPQVRVNRLKPAARSRRRRRRRTKRRRAQHRGSNEHSQKNKQMGRHSDRSEPQD